MIRKIFLLGVLSGLVVAVSCKSNDALPNADIEIISGNNQTGIIGEYLLEPIIIKVSSKYPPDMLMVIGKEVDGFGRIFVEKLTSSFEVGTRPILDENYEARIYPSLGCNAGIQNFTIEIRSTDCEYGEECTLLGSTTVTVTANENPSEWTKVCGSIKISKIIKYNGIAYGTTSPYFLDNRSSLMQSNDLINWEPIEEFDLTISAFDILSDGSILVLTNDGVFKSSNGISWQNIGETLLASGITLYSPELLAEDSVITVINIINEFDSYAQLYRTRDNGETWDDVEIPMLNSIKRSKNGSLFGFNSESSLYTSNNSGNSWNLLSYSGSLSGNIVSVISPDSDHLLILSNDQISTTESQSATVKRYLYSLNLNTMSLEEIEIDAYISDIQAYDDKSFILTSSGDIYSLTSELQKVAGPQKIYPDAKGFFAFGFDHLFINGADQFLISGLNETYLNF